jgi:sodium-dependent dicarboxylate transporter 2/3/5
LLLVVTALAASTGFALPIATPPNAIVFGSGQVRVRDMVRAGLMLDVAAVIVVVVMVSLLFPVVFG